jgi:hypothetical protein
MSNGKGSNPRPISVSSREYEDNWERTFGSKKKKMEQKIQGLQEDINKLKDYVDYYSGLPNTASYDNKGEYYASERNQDYRTEP